MDLKIFLLIYFSIMLSLIPITLMVCFIAKYIDKKFNNNNFWKKIKKRKK